MRVKTARKIRSRRPVVLKINVDNRFEKILGVRSEQIGLAALAHAFDQQRFSISSVSPFPKKLVCLATHTQPSLMNFYFTIF